MSSGPVRRASGHGGHVEQQREPRFSQIADGVWAQVEDRSQGLPRHLDASAHEGRIQPCHCRPLLESMTSVLLLSVVLSGTRLACRDQHDLIPFASGAYRGLDLRLRICRFCGAVEVRDVSVDVIVDHDLASGRRLSITQRRESHRRDLLLGWYAGRRVSGRIYR